MSDVIDQIIGINSGSKLDTVRRHRPNARAHAEGAYRALLHPEDDGEFARHERFAVAVFVAVLHALPSAIEFYSTELLTTEHGSSSLLLVLRDEAERGIGIGPYGTFSEPGLSHESTEGPSFEITTIRGAYILGERLAAALEHAHLLVFHPRDCQRRHLQSLLDAGWSTDGIVSLSQLVAFLTFQLRVIGGLATLAVATSTAEEGR